MELKVGIIIQQYLHPGSREPTVGGVQTYVHRLACALLEAGHQPVICQFADESFEQDCPGGYSVVATRAASSWLDRDGRRALYQLAEAHLDPARDLVLYSSERLAMRQNRFRSLLIQHGISWDIWPPTVFSQESWNFGPINRLRRRWNWWEQKRQFAAVPNRVCVDYNYLNWLRASSFGTPPGRTWVIPNFAAVASPGEIGNRREKPGTVRIAFARRFVHYRGTTLMAVVTERLLAAGLPVEFGFFGEGPDEAGLRKRFSGEPRVQFGKYSPEEATKIHLDYDVAVIPSIGSEGTCLAVAEAMGAGCAVVATNVGGITNMILDGYNGLMVEPNADELFRAVQRLVQDPEGRQAMAARGYDVACQSFSLDRWAERWRQVVTEICDQPWP